MPTITLTMTESETELIAGIPEYVEFSTNEPSTVFYTLDGTEPDDDSTIATGRVYLPTVVSTFTLKAVALIQESASVILEQRYAVEFLDKDRTGRIDYEGIRLLPANLLPIASLSFDADGYAAQQTVIEVDDLDIKTSRTNRIGEDISYGSSKEFIRFVEYEVNGIENEYRSSPNNDNVEFNPNAKVIVINGYDQEDTESQVVKIINRPHGTMTVASPFYNEHLNQEPIVTGNFVRTMYNPNTQKIVFYYTESRENRWIKSIQKVENPIRLNITGSMSPGFVFQWIEDRAMSKIF
jgi:hypothetical protein